MALGQPRVCGAVQLVHAARCGTNGRDDDFVWSRTSLVAEVGLDRSEALAVANNSVAQVYGGPHVEELQEEEEIVRKRKRHTLEVRVRVVCVCPW